MGKILGSGEGTYEEGVIAGVDLYATGCSNFTCDECPLGLMAGEGIPCQTFIKQFPKKATSLLLEMSEKPVTYAMEYSMRMPESSGTAQQLFDAGLCRKLLFDGDASCSGGDCVACWSKIYREDGEE